MAVLTNMNLTSQSQVHLARSLERILEEAHLSGELNLSGRKLKDFPNSGGKYDLSDSVIVVNSRTHPLLYLSIYIMISLRKKL
ncbi:hypothetical protein M8J77_008082 [Diaphorina citri]|nr:hypothetical protein M8J77_008082 [Diaphorina citri]